MVDLSVLKGTKDRLPSEQVLREQIINEIKKVFQLYGFQPATTPILEIWEVLASKYAGGEEILKETYKLTDQGNRALGLRYDLSVPLARLVGMNPQLSKPFKRYEIGPCFRDGPIKKGRYREFIQCDADTIGVTSMLADAECLAVAHQIFRSLGIDVYLEVNNRKLLSGILISAGVPTDLLSTTILSIDKMKKIGVEGVQEELNQKGISSELSSEIFEYFTIEGDYLDILNQLEKKMDDPIGLEGISELRELHHYISLFGIVKDVKLLYSLARGLEIYTGTVFEAFTKDPELFESSLCGGGRYDKIIGKFIDNEQEMPAVGISFGLDTIYDALASQRTIPESTTQVFIIPIKTLDTCLEIASELRKNGISTEVDLLNRRVSKNMEHANRMQIPYVIIVGKRDLAKNMVTLKDMKEGKESSIQRDELLTKLQKSLLK
ncbi:MAG: histidine--tRNA ligase [Candidatus Hodarchaeales archaeon]|jgi:histidyl-tRNA synthetase